MYSPINPFKVAIATALMCSSSAALSEQTSQQIVLVSKLVDPNGAPAPNASAVVDMVDNKTTNVTRTAYKSDSKGNVVIRMDPTAILSQTPVFYVVSANGFGLLDVGNAPRPGAVSPSTLVPFTSLRVRVVDANGFPLAHVQICPASLNGEALYGLASDPILNDWVQTTDDYGCVTIPRLPQGFKLQLNILDGRYAALDPQAYIQLGNTATTTEAVVKLRAIGTTRQFGAPFEEAMGPIHGLP
jgi:hypothetical protein